MNGPGLLDINIILLKLPINVLLDSVYLMPNQSLFIFSNRIDSIFILIKGTLI